MFRDLSSLQNAQYIRLNDQRYKIKEQIGEGSYAKVYKALKNDSSLVALSLLTQFYPRDVENFKRLKEQNWKHCVLPKAVCEQDRKHLFIEYELYDGDISQQQFNESSIDQMIFNISMALRDIHSDNLIHCDIKPQNILYKKQGLQVDYSLCDFGVIQNVGTDHEFLGTALYMPPKVNPQEQIGTSADIWAFGLTIYEIIQGEPFFPLNSTVEDLENKKINEQFHQARIYLIKNVKYRNLILNTVKIQQNERMTAQEIMQYISDIKRTIPIHLVTQSQIMRNQCLQLQKPINFRDFIKSQKYNIPNNYKFSLRSENKQDKQPFKCEITQVNQQQASNQQQKIKIIKVYQTCSH